jgi:hypothetical protein
VLKFRAASVGEGYEADQPTWYLPRCVHMFLQDPTCSLIKERHFR